MRHIFTAAAITLAWAPAALASTRGEIDALLSAYHAAWTRSDAGALSALFTRDAELIDPSGTAEGADQISRHYRAAFAAGLAGSRLETRVERVAAVGRDAVYGRGVWRITLVPSSSATPPPPTCGRFFTVLRRGTSGLRIADYQEAVVACGDVSL